MTTKRQIIAMAYEAVGLAGFIYDLMPEQMESARQKLDAMMAEWNGRGLNLSWPIPSSPENGDIDDETNLPDWALEAVYLSLGPRLANSHGKQVTPMYLAMMRAAKNGVMSRTVKPAARKMPGGFPLGAGYKTPAAFSADPDAVISTNNEELEL
jgi:P22 tail accessory factor